MSVDLSVDPRKQETAELLADCEQIYDVLKALLRAGVRVSFFMSTDRGPEIWVFPSEELSRFNLDRYILSSEKVRPSQVDKLCEVMVSGVHIKWTETQFLTTKSIKNRGGV